MSRPDEFILVSDNADEKYRKEHSSQKGWLARFRSQVIHMELPSHQIILTPRLAFISVLAVGFVCVIYGSVLLSGALSIKEFEYNYTYLSALGESATIQIPITDDLTGTLGIYIRFTNTYLNTRNFVTSSSDSQLSSGNLALSTDSTCKPNGFPCGLVAASYFNDSFVFRINRNDSMSFLQITESPSDIVGPTALKTANPAVITDAKLSSARFWLLAEAPPTICRAISAYNSTPRFDTALRYLENNVSVADCTLTDSEFTGTTCTFNPSCEGDYEQITNPAGWGLENSHFRNWMEIPALPTFQKLYAKISQNLYAGDNILVDIVTRWPASLFGGSLSVVISEINWQGGKGVFLGAALVTVGLIYIFGILIIMWTWSKNKRVQGAMTGYNFANSKTD